MRSKVRSHEHGLYFPYADANLKTLLVAAIDSPIVLTILKDEEPGGHQG